MRILFFFISLLMCSHLTAQDKVIFKGKVVNGSTPIFNVTVLNLSQSQGVITDYEGNFSLLVNQGDTIQFTSIGYKPVTYNIPDSLTSESFRVLVNMVEDTILLKEAVIVPWPINTTMLKEAMLSKTKEKEKISAYAGFKEIEGDPVEPEPKLFSNPISFIFDKLSKKSRQEKKMQKYREMLQEDEMYVPEEKY